MDNNGETNAFKRKRKKSFLKKQKQYGKKGRFGQGVELSEDAYQYFIRILEVLKIFKESSDDMGMLASNVLDEIVGREVDTCSNQLASRVIEEVLKFSPDDKLLALGNTMASELRLVYSDPYCSHVLQRLVIVLTERIVINENGKRSQDIINQLKTCFTRIAMFGFNNLEDFIYDTYANHVLRTLFFCVNGNPVKSETDKTEIKEEFKVVPSEFEDLANTFVKKVATWPQFNDLSTQILPSGCLQALFLSVKNNPKLCKTLVSKLLETCKSISNFDLMDEKHGSLLHLIESAILVAPPKLFKELYDLLFKDKIKDLAVSKTSNFAVQKVLLNCIAKEIFEEMFNQLSNSFSPLLKNNFTGILLALAKGCRQFKTKQGDFCKNLFGVLQCEDTEERQLLTSSLIYCLVPFEKYDAKTSKINLHGSLILQEMLHFTKPIRLVNSILAMSTESLITLLSDPRGSHVTDAFISSEFVGEKSREKLFKKLLRHYPQLAISRHGSRSFDAIWSRLNAKQMSIIMDELKSQQSLVVSTQCGRVISSKTQLDLYRQDKEKWMKQIDDKTQSASISSSKDKKKKEK